MLGQAQAYSQQPNLYWQHVLHALLQLEGIDSASVFLPENPNQPATSAIAFATSTTHPDISKVALHPLGDPNRFHPLLPSYLTPQDLSRRPDAASLQNAQIKSLAVIPLTAHGTPIAWLQLASQSLSQFNFLLQLQIQSLLPLISNPFASQTASHHQDPPEAHTPDRMKKVFEGTGDGFWDWDLMSNNVVYSERWGSMLGYDQNELTPSLQTWETLVHPEDHPGVIAAIQAHLEGQTPTYSSEHRLRCKSGEWKWILDRGRVVERNPQGQPTRACGTHTDITHLKLTELELHQQDRLLQALSQTLNLLLEEKEPYKFVETAFGFLGQATEVDRVYLFQNEPPEDQDGSVRLSQRFEWNSGTSKPQINNPELQHIPYDPAYTRWFKVLSSGEAISGLVKDFPESEQELLQAQEILSVLAVPIFIHGEFWGFIGFDDCHLGRTWSRTEKEILRVAASGIGTAFVRYQIEESLQVFSLAVAQSPVSILITDAAGRIQFANNKFLEVTGLNETEAVGQIPPQFKSDLTAPDVIHSLWNAIQKGSAWQGQIRSRRGNNDVFWAQLSISPILDSQGVATRFVALMEDITHRRQIEERMLESLREQQSTNRLKSDFITLVSHEFRTPLAAILNATELLEDSYDLLSETKRQSFFNMITTEVHRLSAMLQEILALGKIDAGQMQLRKQPVELLQLCQGVAQEAHLAFQKHPAIKILTTTPITTVQTDPQLLYLILLNLLSNALKYSPQNTTTTLTASTDNNVIRLEIVDHGIGIPPSAQSHLFEAFYRAPNVGQIKGTGVGLYVTNRCVELLHGKIEVSSTPGEGSRFVVQLPQP
jgi:PAS domain S-box-containing protein